MSQTIEPIDDGKVSLDFMIVPSELSEKCYVPDPLTLRIIDPEAIFLTGILGESGRKMVKAGLLFYFKRELGLKLIEKGIAEDAWEQFLRKVKK
jgi:hypothetical protein